MKQQMKRAAWLGIFLIISVLIHAQDTKTNPLTISGYAEVYYQYDFNNPVNNKKPSFVYSYNRNNEVALNLGFIKASYNTDNIRGNLALAAGTYMNANYAAEEGVFKNVYEANVGVKLSSKNSLWLDAGIFSSHIGFESAIGKDCWNLTRSMVADNSPYFETGAKLSYTSKNEKWFLSALLLNGWQRIQRTDGNSTPAFGTQITYKPNENITLNYSNFIGNDKPDSGRLMRNYHNVYGIFQLNKKWAATLGFDIGAEQKTKGSSSTNSWYAPVAMLRYTPGAKTAIAVRVEYYSDKNGVIIATGTPNGFQTWGFSANFDYVLAANVSFRIEAKNLSSKDAIFEKRNGSFVSANTNLATTIAINF
jgi:hypothetical protein